MQLVYNTIHLWIHFLNDSQFSLIEIYVMMICFTNNVWQSFLQNLIQSTYRWHDSSATKLIYPHIKIPPLQNLL